MGAFGRRRQGAADACSAPAPARFGNTKLTLHGRDNAYNEASQICLFTISSLAISGSRFR